jgi:hypothetical protein
MRTLLAVLLALAANPTASYRRYPVHELLIGADLIVVGSIQNLGETTYTFKVESALQGASQEHVTVHCFENWTCARRARKYAVGQRSLLFLRPTRDGNYYAMGAGNEGDMALTADDRVVLEYPLKGYATEKLELDGARLMGALVPLAEVRGVVERFPRMVEWDWHLEDGEPTGWIAALRAREGQAAFEAFAASSNLAGHLHYEVVTRPYYQSGEEIAAPRPIPESLPRIDLGRADFQGELVWMGDMDGDGLPDWASLVGSIDAKRVQLALSQGSASNPVFVPIRQDPVGDGPSWQDRIGLGGALQAIGDLDGNGYMDLLVGQAGGEPRGDVRGDVWLVYLGERGRVLRAVSLGTQEPLNGLIAKQVLPAKKPWPVAIGAEAVCLGATDGAGILKVVLLADADILSRTPPVCYCVSINREGGVLEVVEVLEPDSEILSWIGIGRGLVAPGDVDGDGHPDLVLVLPYHPDGRVGDEQGPGALVVIGLDARGRARTSSVISVWQGGLEVPLRPGDQLADVVVPVGDVDQDGTPDLLVGGGDLDDENSGALWLLHLTPRGTVHAATEIRDGRHGFTDQGRFPRALAAAPSWSESGRLPLLLKGLVKSDERQRPVLWSLYLDRQGKVLPR